MITTLCNLIRSLSVTALLAAAAISVPVGAVHAEAQFPSNHGTKSCTLNGKTYPADTTFTTNGKEYHCDGYEGSWIVIIEDEDRDSTPPSHPLSIRIAAALRSGVVRAQP